ncbi:hypothetical protein, conserved in T. vivax [Trypanosoma vivax Y486]|uniref:Uncharacterized protein n=1 Tax=Trypanosoma vivax (strain Y486) TaxID=1055687 RepID=F9WLU7_TRYVY|nr:hypothetical protein, conserved in T. vivax [Trypanosoma vivax Y486]|eukprot:CCD18491.1 hypothetical protein, conserved in T. vivax [Trypanosoma vivax Y486]
MVSKGFCILLLFSVVYCDALHKPKTCWPYDSPTKNQKCAAQDVIWGWMNILNKPALMAEEVMKNVSEVMHKTRGLRKKAEVAISEYERVLASLISAGNEDAEIVNNAIENVRESIARANEVELVAENAAKEASGSLYSTTTCFHDIVRAAHMLWDINVNVRPYYTSVKAALVQHRSACEREYNSPKVLEDNKESIDGMNLTEWKIKTLQVLQKTYKDINSSKCKYHWTLWSGEKALNVENAVKDRVNRLGIAVHNFKLYFTAVNDAEKKLDDASRKVEGANNSLLAFVNGKVYCEVVDQFSKSDGRLKPVERTLTAAKQNAASVVTDSERVLGNVKVAYKLVSDVVMWLKGDGLTFTLKWLGTHNIDNATRSVGAVSESMSKFVRDASEASTAVNTTEQEVDARRQLLMRAKKLLANMSATAWKKDGKATFEACNSSVSEILKNKSPEVIRRIARLNKTLLAELNASLHKIDGEADALVRDLSAVNSKVEEASSSAREASQLAKLTSENVKETIVKVLSGVVANLCAALGELRALHDESEIFNAHAVHAEANISEWLVRVDAARESDALVDLSGSVEDAFATAGKRLQVLKRVLHRADEQRDKVVGELTDSAVVAGHSSGDSLVNKTLRDVLVNITSTVSATFSRDVCSASLMPESLKLLSNMTDRPAVMSSLHVVAQLNRLANSMEGQVLRARRLIQVAADSSAQVDAALEEAVRMARERSGKPQCPALYQQLLGALGLHW